MINIYVPTYGRKQPAILSMLDKDVNICINLCVRTEDYRNGFYDHLKNIWRINIIPIGENIHDIGETRQAILKYCYDRNIQYCTMIDDGITNIKDTTSRMSISQCVENAIYKMRNDVFSDLVFMYGFYREGMRYIGVHKDDTYFVGLTQQAFVIDVSKCYKHNIIFKPLNVCGIEDIAFLLDGIKEGLITIGNTNLVIEGKMPNKPEIGGNHKSLSNKDLASRYDSQHKVLEKYIGNIYGMSLEKKFRKSLNESVTYAILNYAYFRDVLVFNRDKNSDIISAKFMKM